MPATDAGKRRERLDCGGPNPATTPAHARMKLPQPTDDVAPADALVVNAVLIAVRQAANVLCDRWSLITLLFAHAGVDRFADFRERSGMANRELTSRLKALEEQEIMVRLPYTRRPLRYSYHLTHMGLQLFDVFATLMHWEHAWHPAHGAARVLLEHLDCGAKAVEPRLRCAHCQDVLTARSVGRLTVSQKEIERMPAKETGYRRSTVGLAQRGVDQQAPLAHAIEIFGDKWGIEIIVSAFLRVRTFGGFQAHIGISTNILADRLSRLVRLGILRQTTADEPGRTGAYALTEKGIALYPILLAIQAWADDWLRGRVRSPVKLKHRPCGEPLRLVVACDQCGTAVTRANARLHIIRE